jgi:hypothetical protein
MHLPDSRMDLPEPLAVPWTMKPLASAATELRTLDDGRLFLSLRHDVLRGLTPEMVRFWFQNIAGDMQLEGRRVARYRVWHPRDHVAFRLARRGGSEVGPGAVFHIQECFGRDPRWALDAKLHVTRLDDGGFATQPKLFGIPGARMTYRFTQVRSGTLYENDLTVGVAGARWLNEAVLPRIFPKARGQAWLLHNVEEVGNLEFFLPSLIAEIRGERR